MSDPGFLDDESDEVLHNESDEVTPTYQQSVVYDRCRDNCSDIVNANDNMASRASLVLAGSAAAFTVSGIAASNSDSFGLAVVASAVGIVTLVTLVLAGSIWMPRDGYVPGSMSTDDLYSECINVDPDDCYSQVLNDLTIAYSQESDRNTKIATRLWWMICFFDAQILLSILCIWMRVYS